MENTDVCAEKYRYSSAIYLMSVMFQCYWVHIDQGISAPGHGKDVLYGLNDDDKRYIYHLMSNGHILGTNRIDSKMQMHTGNLRNDESLDK